MFAGKLNGHEGESMSSGLTTILGLSAFYHGSAAALIIDGEIVAAAQEERFTRKKHDHHFPSNAVAWCMRHGRIAPVDGRQKGIVSGDPQSNETTQRLEVTQQGLRPFRLRWPTANNAILEAMARGVPIVTENHEEFPIVERQSRRSCPMIPMRASVAAALRNLSLAALIMIS